ncbi:MAG: sensor domain-containing protein [Acidiferrobacteraceae bacterium]
MNAGSDTGKPLRALIIEDSADDSEILARALTRGGYALSYERVDTEAALETALDTQCWDIVFADYSMPRFSGAQALACVRARGDEIPFIFVSGTIGEDVAVSAMKAGAQDYLMKGHLKRLVPAVERELRDSEHRRERSRTQTEHRAMEARFRSILTMAADAIIALDGDERIILFNQAAERLFGYRVAEVHHQPLALLLPLSRTDPQGPAEARFLNQQGEMYGRRKDGSGFPVEANVSRLEENGETTFTIILRDMTERRRAETEARFLQDIAVAVRDAGDVPSAFMAALGKICHDLRWSIGQVWMPDAHNKLTCTPIWYCRETGLERFRLESLAREATEIVLPARVRATREPVWIADVTREPGFARADAARDVGLHAAVAIPVAIDDELTGVIELFARESRLPDPQMMRVLAAASARIASVIQRKRAEERIQHLAHHDALTDLPNRVLFHERLRRALWDARRYKHLVGVAFLDLDRFKTINDSLGHGVGDQLLKAVATALASCVREGDTVARLSGDEFAVIFAQVRHADEVGHVANRILRTLAEPLLIDGHELFTSVSMGITLYPLDDDDAGGLVQNADIAMYRAKESGGNAFQFYTPEMTVKAQERHALENDLRRALDQNEFVLYYQPIVALSSGQVTGAEALLRWQWPGHGIIGPGQFIPLAEETGLIARLGQWVVRTACAQTASLDLPDLRIAVNCSPRQFQQSDLCDIIAEALEQSRLDGHRLEIEITETLLMQNATVTLAAMQRLNGLGVTFAVDDFGTGYSSLSYLKQLPIGRLKIDQSFVRDVPGDPNDVAIVRAIVSMAHGLGIQVVAEGVETEAQLAFVRNEGCDAAQGYYFSRPLPFEAFARWVRDGRSPPWVPEENAPGDGCPSLNSTAWPSGSRAPQ